MKLKEIRKAKGISQLKLALDLNMSQNTISRYETGEREPGINELIKIADYFNISVDYLLGRTNNPNMQKIVFNHRFNKFNFNTTKTAPYTECCLTLF